MIFGKEFLNRFTGGQIGVTQYKDKPELQGEIESINFTEGTLRVKFSWAARYNSTRNKWYEDTTRDLAIKMNVGRDLPGDSIVVLGGASQTVYFVQKNAKWYLEREGIMPPNPDLQKLTEELQAISLDELDSRLNALGVKEATSKIREVYYDEYDRRKAILPQ